MHGLKLGNHVQEGSGVIKRQICQIIRKVGKVVPDAYLGVISQVSVNTYEAAHSFIFCTIDFKQSPFDYCIPFLHNVNVAAQHEQGCGTIKEIVVAARKADFASTMSVLAT